MLKSNDNDDFHYFITEQTGKLLLSGRIGPSESIDINVLNSGHYFLTINNSNLIYHEKFIVQK